MYFSKAKNTSSKEEVSKENNYLIFIVGPTASGKSSVAMQLAKRFDLEIISADSRQFYRQMAIGTAKPTKQDQLSVPHHFVDFRNIYEHLNAGEFENAALQILPDIFSRKNTSIVCGGSGLYLNALAYGLDDLPKADQQLRKELQESVDKEGLQSLLKELERLDPEFFKEVDRANPKRVIRALEVCILSGKRYSQLRKAQKKRRPFKTLWFGIDRPREELNNRINRRVDKMMSEGLLDEVKSLIEFRSSEALNTVGYAELFSYLDGEISLNKAIELIKQNTRRYAKRQMTWFRRNDEINWIDPIEGIPEEVLPFI